MKVICLLAICCLIHVKHESVTRNQVDESISKGVKWLTSMTVDGAFVRTMGDKKIPSVALTGLALNAIAGSSLRDENKDLLDKSCNFLLSSQNEDGSFSEKGGLFKSYCTSIVVMALNNYDRAKFAADIEKAQKYLVKAQVKEGMFEGGFGYSDLKASQSGIKESKVADMSNTSFAAEALEETGLDDKEVWNRLVKFVSKCQNSSEAQIDPVWAKLLEEKGFKLGDDGGAFYTPSLNKDDQIGGVTSDKDNKN
ncbi:MAG: terpene cyclase/mutase family protein, partial [Planctomycetes bacterium]|nr:terpene cyclase/mutase family protein [Planctomycetota bacterium]